MDLNHFNTPDVAPMLVKLYDTQRVYELAQNKNPEARSELAGMIAELLNMNLTARESELIADVLIALLHKAELKLRKALSTQLSRLPNVPLRLILELANDDITVARPILEHSTVLGEMDLIYIIKSKPADYWRAIAKRTALNESVVDSLANTGDGDTAIILANNDNISLTDHAARILGDMASEYKDLAEPLLRRTDVCQDIHETLYLLVGDAMKHDIKKRHDVADDTLDQAMNDAITTLQTDKHDDDASAFVVMNEHILIDFLKQKELTMFIDGLQMLSGLDRDICIRIMSDNDPRMLAVICRAKGIQKAEFMSLYLLSGIFRDEEKTANTPDTSRAIKLFDGIRPEKAQATLEKMI